MVRRWNSVVSPHDKVYVLGDVAMRKQHLSTIDRCHGTKVLVSGNHDIFGVREYLKHFKEVYAMRYPETREFVMSHIPLHPDSVRERYKINVHGHLHAHRVMLGSEIDPMYFNVSVEQIDYTPISHEDLLKRIADQQ